MDAQAQLELANCYGQQNDCAKSLHFYKLAAANGIADAQQFLAERYYHAVGVPLDYCKVVPEHRAHPLLRDRFCASSFLSAGHEVVCQGCGSRAGQSSGAHLSALSCRACFIRHSLQAHSQAMMATCYRLGRGVERDIAEAV